MSRCMPEAGVLMVYAVERAKISDGYGLSFCSLFTLQCCCCPLSFH